MKTIIFVLLDIKNDCNTLSDVETYNCLNFKESILM